MHKNKDLSGKTRTGVWVADDKSVSGIPDGLNERSHVSGTQGTVKTEAKIKDKFKLETKDKFSQIRSRQKRKKNLPERFGVRHAGDKCLASLSGQSPAALVHDRATDHNRHLLVFVLKELLDGEQGGLGVGRVEDGLHQQEVDASVQEAAGLLLVGGTNLVKS